jgi:RimJ/RimL family protein N-acetyltransferase
MSSPARPDLRLDRLAHTPAGEAAVQRVLAAAPGYFHRISGGPPGPAEAGELFAELPAGKSFDDKFVYGIEADGRLVGCLDLLRGYPVPGTAFLGLLLLSEAHQRRGIGCAAYALAESIVRSWSCDTVRLGVVATNGPALCFWRACGFRATGERRPHRLGTVVSEILLFDKVLA